MKLKKIASLAMAGVMAVSMLAGCSGTNVDDDNDVVVTPSASSIVTAVNNGQSAANAVKVEFTSDSELDAALKVTADALGADASEEAVANYMNRLIGLPADHDFDGMMGFYAMAQAATNMQTDVDDYNNVSYTALDVIKIDDMMTEKAAERMAADTVDTQLANLKVTTCSNEIGLVDYGDSYVPVNKTEIGDKYVDFTYAGNVSMVSIVDADGTTSYYVVYTVTQTGAVKTLDRA